MAELNIKTESKRELDTNKTPDEKSCGVVLFRENYSGGSDKVERLYLLLHYPGGHIDFPKGHVEPGEENDEHVTARRELTEETGIKEVEFIDGFRHLVHYTYNKKGHPSFKEVVFFAGKTNEKDVTISFEHRDHYWLPYAEALNKLTFENAKNLLVEVEKFVSKKGL